MAMQLFPKRHPHEGGRTLLQVKPGDEEEMLTEADLTPITQQEAAGACFAPIPGLKIVESAKTDFFHHGWPIVDEPCAGITPPASHEDPPQATEQQVGARIPAEAAPGETVVDVETESALFPDVSRLNLSEAERSYDDPRHIMRGGPQMASR